MSNDTKKDTVETGGEISRRALLEKAALVVGVSAASVATARSAFARSSDVSIDSSGKVNIDGAIVGAQDAEAVDVGETCQVPPGNRKAAKAKKPPSKKSLGNLVCVNALEKCANTNTDCINTLAVCARRLRS